MAAEAELRANDPHKR